MNTEILNYRKTYIHLSEVKFYLDDHLKLVKDKNLFLTSFSAFFLLEKPFFDHSAHDKNSIQTFYANHYLREVLNINSLPSSNLIYEYSKSTAFAQDQMSISESIGISNSQNISYFLCKENNSKQLSPSDGLISIISFLLTKVKNNSLKYIKPVLTEPSSELLSVLKTKGFYVLENFVENNDLRKIKKITSLIAESEAKSGNGYFYGEKGINQRIYNLINKHPIFVDLICHPFMMNLLNQVYDRQTLHEKFSLNSMTAHIVAPGAKSIPLHIDSVVPEPIPKTMIRCIAILALDEFTNNNGATALVPGSHKLYRRPTPNDVKKAKTFKAVCKAGSLIIFNGSVWHHSTSNTSPNPRMGLMLSYAASYFQEISGEEEHLSIIPKKTLESFSLKMKQMVGYKNRIKKGALYRDEDLYNLDLNNF